MPSAAEIKRFYDRLGRLLDTQAFYEDRGMSEIAAHGRFEEAKAVFEFGCGTGRLAGRLLAGYLPRDSRYLGVDVSETMAAIASKRLARWGPRVEVKRTDGSLAFPAAGAAFDRFLTTYVLDLLSDQAIGEVLNEARRILAPGGLFCAATLTHGAGGLSRLVSRVWQSVHDIRPMLLGGCRPISISGRLPADGWTMEHQAIIARWGLTSEVLIARKPD